MSGMGFWTDARVEKLRGLLAEGCSASMAAEEIGCTRNAVIGIAARRKIAFAGAATGSLRDRMQRVRTRRGPGKASAVCKQRLPPAAAAPQPAALAPVEPLFVKSLWLSPQGPVKLPDFLRAGDCRYPFGDVLQEDFGFCGAARREGSPYCAGHHRLCYVPRAPARRFGRLAA